jgi:DNA-directed RNA polymerase beta subunit
MGEMEFHALIAHEGEHTIDECATTKSDCIDRKNKYIIETITSEDISYLSEDEEFCEKGESIMLLEAWLLQLGVKR